MVSPPLGNSGRAEACLKTVLHCWNSLKKLPPISELSPLCLIDVCTPVSELHEFTSKPYTWQSTFKWGPSLHVICFSTQFSLPAYVPMLNALCRVYPPVNTQVSKGSLRQMVYMSLPRSFLNWLLWIIQSLSRMSVWSNGSGMFLSWKLELLRLCVWKGRGATCCITLGKLFCLVHLFVLLLFAWFLFFLDYRVFEIGWFIFFFSPHL